MNINTLFYKLINNNSELASVTNLNNSIIDHLPNHYIFWKDINSVFLGCNKAFALTANLASPAEIIGKTDYDLPWSKEESDAYRADDRLVMASRKGKLNIEEPQTLANGDKIILLTSKVPLIDDNGKVYGVLAIYSDITEQKLNEKKLIEANQKIEKASQVKSEFIRNISHDIRTPLSGIQQTLQAIADGKILEAEIPEYAYAGWEASNKLMELFNQVIDISKNEHSDCQDSIVKFDLYQLLEDLKETYHIVAKHKGLIFEIEYSNDIPQYILGKHLRLHRVLMNILGNALKFTEKGNVKLVIEQSLQKDDKVILRFSVIDSGIGISKDKQQFIFEPFTRISPSFQGQYPGSGLGLHVVKEYIEKMQGEIYVESEEGNGSIFTCVLPFKLPILNNDNDVIEEEYKQKISSNEVVYYTKNISALSSLKNGKVLLVEDDSLAQNMGALILKNIGYQVDLAKSGEEALQLSNQNTYDIIFMDIGLPGIDGIETTQRIRSNQNNPSKNALIVGVTAHADDEIAHQCVEAGMQKILLKPLTKDKAQQVFHFEDCVIDFDLWKNRLGDNVSMMSELFHTLAKDFDNNKHEIINAYEANDLIKLKSVAHKIKGGLKYCGLPRLETAIVAIENAAKNNNKLEVDKYYQETLNAFDEAKQAYEDWKKK